MPSNSDETRDTPADSTADQGPLIYSFAELFRGRKEVWIEMDDEMYRLRLTSKGKLLLSK